MNKPFFQLNAIRIVALYSVLSLLWIFGSDQLLQFTVTDPWLGALLSTLKGVAYVAMSACLLYLLLANWRKQQFYEQQTGTRMKQWRLVGLVLNKSLSKNLDCSLGMVISVIMLTR